jgi:hypothetical protein
MTELGRHLYAGALIKCSLESHNCADLPKNDLEIGSRLFTEKMSQSSGQMMTKTSLICSRSIRPRSLRNHSWTIRRFLPKPRPGNLPGKPLAARETNQARQRPLRQVLTAMTVRPFFSSSRHRAISSPIPGFPRPYHAFSDRDSEELRS